ncbi:hypothetical protein D3C71_1972280 [compost metagenome]
MNVEKPRRVMLSQPRLSGPYVFTETPGVYWTTSMMSSAPRASISSRPTTEIDCGVSRIGVSVLVAVALRVAT